MDQIENTLSLKVAKKMMAALKFRQQRDIYYKRTIKEITVTEQMLIDKFNSQKGLCYWSGLRLDDKYNLLSKHPFSISVERLNNDLGYTPDNIVLTRRIFNLGRSDFSESEFLNVINDLKEELKG